MATLCPPQPHPKGLIPPCFPSHCIHCRTQKATDVLWYSLNDSGPVCDVLEERATNLKVVRSYTFRCRRRSNSEPFSLRIKRQTARGTGLILKRYHIIPESFLTVLPCNYVGFRFRMSPALYGCIDLYEMLPSQDITCHNQYPWENLFLAGSVLVSQEKRRDANHPHVKLQTWTESAIDFMFLGLEYVSTVQRTCTCLRPICIYYWLIQRWIARWICSMAPIIRVEPTWIGPLFSSRSSLC